MVDAPDLGSGGVNPREGSSPSSRISFILKALKTS